MKIIIACGGKNTRAKPVTGDVPKALYPIAGKPALGRILDWVTPMDFSTIHIVVAPETVSLFDRYLLDYYRNLDIELIVQKFPAGDGDAVRVAYAASKSPFKYSREPVLVMLGDKIPYGINADLFQAHLKPLDNRKPPYSRLGCEESTSDGLRFNIKSNKFVETLHEQRGDDSDQRLKMVFNGIAYIKRGDYLYDKLQELRRQKIRHYGEYRIGPPFKEMFRFGESFHAFEMKTLDVGTPSAIQKAILCFYDEQKRWEIASH